jgi:hypothetical protein
MPISTCAPGCEVGLAHSRRKHKGSKEKNLPHRTPIGATVTVVCLEYISNLNKAMKNGIPSVHEKFLHFILATGH